jgi:hypothetical protein
MANVTLSELIDDFLQETEMSPEQKEEIRGNIGAAGNASELSYDPTASELEATNTQAAIDEVKAKGDAIDGRVTTLEESPGGGGTISDPGVAYIRTDGDDDTGEIGNPGKPFDTAQAAWDAGARSLNLGVGSFGLTRVGTGGGDDVFVFVRGAGADLTSLELTWTANSGEAVPPTLILGSDHSVTFGLTLLGSRGEAGEPGTSEEAGGAGGDGTEPPSCELLSCVLNITQEGGSGGSGGADNGGGEGSEGTPGGDTSAYFHARYCYFQGGYSSVAATEKTALFCIDDLGTI